MPDDVAEIARGLSKLEVELLTGQAACWGSWMADAGLHMVSLGLGTSSNGNISFDTPLGLAVRAYLTRKDEDDG